MGGRRVIGGLLLAALMVIAGGAPGRAAPAELLQDHPLTGTIWNLKEQRQAAPLELFEAAAKARWVMLGEKHDNAEHHRIQALVVGALGQRGRRPAVVWEMTEPRHDAALKAARLEDLSNLGPAVAWEERGWPAWAEYQPIAEQALTHGMTLAAGDAPPDVRRKLGRDGELDSAIAARLNFSRNYDPAQQLQLSILLADAHCGVLPAAAIPAMMSIQRLRDAWMADVMRREGAAEGAILITGGQHARKDRGVPWHLQPEGGEVFAMTAVEVARGVETASAYPSFDATLYDYIWFTARVDEKDPCEAFRSGGG